MPDRYCFQNDRITSELQQILLPSNGYTKKECLSNSFGATKLEGLEASSPLHGRGHEKRDNLSCKVDSAPKKKSPRGKESSSRHFGVRFRPDLHKWVAEIRVAEWKSVDKKVWLGTFDTEVAAARAVDAARKLLKCKKKRPPNFPCLNLDAYSETLPSNLNLHHLGNDAMFKEVTLFVKRKAQQYAASFGTNYIKVPVIDVEPNILETSNNSEEDEVLQWEDLLFDGQNCSFDMTLDLSFPKSYNNYVDLMIQIDEHESIVGCTDHEMSIWEEPKLFGEDELDNYLLVGSEYDLILSDNQEYCGQEQTSMDIVSEDHEIVDASMDWLLSVQLHSFNNNSFLVSSLDCPQVCQ